MYYQYDSRSEIVKKSVDHFEGANCHHDTDFDLENFRIVVGSVAEDGLGYEVGPARADHLPKWAAAD